MKFEVGYCSDIGKRRKVNQDNGGAFAELGLFIVADGMGGHQGGETASQLCTDIIKDSVAASQARVEWDPQVAIQEAIQKANAAIHHEAEQNEALHGMGTTTTSLLFTDNALTIGHVGDSRCYFFLPNKVWQLTRDHSLVEEKRRAGIITREQVKTDQMKNVITRSVGFEPLVNVDLYEKEVHAGETYLICSDGLSGMIEDREIQAIVERDLFEAGNIDNCVQALVAAANEAGGEDNISVLLIRVLEP